MNAVEVLMKLYRGVNEIHLYKLIYGHSQHFKRSTAIGPSIIYRGEFLKVNGQQPNFRECLYLHSLSPL